MSGLSKGAHSFYAVLASIILVCFGWIILPILETEYFPVIPESAVITKTERIDTLQIKIWGSAVKGRNCAFRGIRWNFGSRDGGGPSIFQFFGEPPKERLPGPFNFGPWNIHLAGFQKLSNSHSDVFHQCYVLREWFGTSLPLWWLTRSRFYN